MIYSHQEGGIVMKISEIEVKLINGDVSSETIEQYKAALNRVPRTHRCQHCYTTAVSMDDRYYYQAVALIHYGLEYCDSWSDRMRAHCNIAIIYEKHKDYSNASCSYMNALDAIPDEHKMPSYLPTYSAHLMRMEMHINNFEYTDNLRKYYALAIQADSFSRNFMKTAFYEAIAEIIIFKKDGKLSEMKQSFEKANEMLSPKHTGPLTVLLKRKGYTETTGATEETLAFLRVVNKTIPKH